MLRTEIIFPHHPLRADVENHIRAAYQNKYDAVIHEFPHMLLAMIDGERTISCACGVRFASTGFFSTSYLEDDASKMISKAFQHNFTKDDILEVTTLASKRTGHAVKLVQQVVYLARQLHKPIGLFTTTQKLKKILERAGLRLVQLADADAMKIKNAKDWGRYYEEQPAVFAVWDDVHQPITLFGAEQHLHIFPFTNAILQSRGQVHV